MDSEWPQFDLVELPPAKSDAQIMRDHLQDRQLELENTELANAETLCYSGNVSAATAAITRLLQAGQHASGLQYCLLGAVLSESQDLVRILLGAGVPASLVNIKPAIKQKSLHILALFLQHGWNINEEEGWYIPPLLSYAVATDPDESVILWFLQNGADPNARCQLDITPLSTAVECAPVPIIEQLFSHCPSSTRFRGYLLHWAARRTSDDAEHVVRLVLERCQPDLDQILYKDDAFSYEVRKSVGLGTALHEAARAGHLSVVQMLIARGTDVTIRDSCGNTALEVAEICENHAAVALLRCAEKSPSPKI